MLDGAVGFSNNKIRLCTALKMSEKVLKICPYSNADPMQSGLKLKRKFIAGMYFFNDTAFKGGKFFHKLFR